MAERRRRLNREVFITFELGRYAAMVAMLLLFFFSIPFTTEGTAVNLVLNVMMVLTLIATIHATWPSRVGLMVLVALACLMLLPVVRLADEVGPVELAAHTAAFCLMLIVVMTILGHVLTVEQVTLDILLGAASVYLFVGVLWGALFALLEYLFPGSFLLPRDVVGSGPTTLLPLRRDTAILYFSFETLTTLGYGDIVPLTPPARFLAILEALVGQLYLAVLVGRLVSLQIMHRTRGT